MRYASRTNMHTVTPALVLFLAFGCSRPTSNAQEHTDTHPIIVVTSVKPETDSALVISYGLTRSDFDRITQIPSVEQAVPLRQTTQEARHGDRTATIRLIGTIGKLPYVDSVEIARGRFLTDADTQGLNNVAVIDRDASKQLFDDKDPVGENIRIGENYFLIVGLAKSATGDRQRKDAPPIAYTPISTMRARLGDREVITKEGTLEASQFELSEIRIAVDRTDNLTETADIVRRLLKANHEKQDYEIRVPQHARP